MAIFRRACPFPKNDQAEESIQELSGTRITSYPPVTAFRRISVLHSQRLRPPSFRIRGKTDVCQLYPWDFSYGQRNWDFVPRAEEHSSALRDHIQKAWDTYENSGTDSFTEKCAPPKDNLPSLFTYYPDTRIQNRRDLTCLLLSRTWDNATISDFGLILEPVHTGSKTYHRVGSFDSGLSGSMYEHWLKDLVRGRFYPSITPNLEDGMVSGSTSRETGFDIPELDIFDNITQDFARLKNGANAVTQENHNPGADTRKRRSSSANSSFNRACSSPHTQGAKPDRLASLTKCLRIFNGTEEETEIEIEIV